MKSSKIKSMQSRFLPIIFAAIFLFGNSSCLLIKTFNAPPQEKASQLDYLAKIAYEEQKYRKAIDHWKKASDIDTANAKFISRIGDSYHQLGNYREALRYQQKIRSKMEDAYPYAAIKMMSWEAGYALSNNLPKQAIQLYEDAIDRMEIYGFNDSTLMTNLYCNWGVADLFDQGTIYPCRPDLLGNCHIIHLSDVQRAKEKFLKASDFSPIECKPEVRWNLNLTERLLDLPEDSIKKYKSYIPIEWVKQHLDLAVDSSHCFFEPLPTEEDTIIVEGGFFEGLNVYDEIVFVLDISGSMGRPVVRGISKTRFELMIETIIDQIENSSEDQHIGILTVNGDCNGIPTLSIPVSKGDKTSLISELKKLYPFGGTPLYTTLQRSQALFSDKKNNKLVLLASDGVESCMRSYSVCGLAGQLCKTKNINFEVFSLLLDESSNSREFGFYECITEACGTVIHIPTREAKIEQKAAYIEPGYQSFYATVEDLIAGKFLAQQEFVISADTK